MADKKRIKRAEQDQALKSLPSDAPLPRRKPRCDKRRPTYKDLVKIESLTGVGMPMEVVASECDVSRTTLERWVREYEDIASALRKGRKKRKMRAFSCLFEQAFPLEKRGDKMVPSGKGNPALMMFWMKTREGLSDRAADERAINKAKVSNLAAEANDTPTIVYNLRQPVLDEEGNPIDDA